MIKNGLNELDLFTYDRDEEYRYVPFEDGIQVVAYFMEYQNEHFATKRKNQQQ